MTRNWYAIATIALAVAGFVFGGSSSQGLIGNTLLQIAAAILLGWTYARARRGGVQGASRMGRLVAAVIAFAVLLQFVPLPPALWTLLPGRSEIADGFRLIGQPLPWLSLSLSPWDSLASLTWWLPMVAVGFAVRDPEGPSFTMIVFAVAGVALFSASLGIVQLVAGVPYPYAITNYGQPVGVFANVNHQASFLVATFALCTGLYKQTAVPSPKAGSRSFAFTLYVGVSAFLLIVVILSGSLAGVMLAALAIAGAVLILREAWRPRKGVIIAGLLAGCVALVAVAQLGDLSSFMTADTDVEGIGRADIWATGFKAAWLFFPIGSGLGTFESIYRRFEMPDVVTPTYINHAHNELLELAIETGLPGLVACGLAMVWVARKLMARSAGSHPVLLAAGLVIAVYALHSLVDYPLRTVSGSILFAIALALLAREPSSLQGPQTVGRRKRGQSRSR